jgi:hypothetical protein
MPDRDEFLILARFIARLRPEIWDVVFPHGPVLRALASGGSAFQEVALNPQPLPPREIFAITLADAHLSEIVRLAELSARLGEEGRAMRKAALTLIGDFDEICPPNWPRRPKLKWPVPPLPWPFEGVRMEPAELFFAGSRFLLASDVVADTELKSALAETGLRLMESGVRDGGREHGGIAPEGNVATPAVAT